MTLIEKIKAADAVYIFTVVRYVSQEDSTCGYVKMTKKEALRNATEGFLQESDDVTFDADLVSGDLWIG